MVEIINNHPHLRVNRRDLARLIRNSAKAKKKSIGCITIELMTDKKIAAIHRKFMNDPTSTDVITFDLSRSVELSGDIVISLDTANRQATEYGVSLRQETGRLAVHGLLHLCGLTDTTPAKRKLMHENEDILLMEEAWLTKE